MKIMIDATSLARTITGIESYTKNLVDNIISINKNENHILFVLFKGNIPSYFKDRQNDFVTLVCPFSSQILCEQIWIPYINQRYKPDVIHFPAFPPPFLLKNKSIYFTVHDATMWKYPETLSVKNKLYMKPLSTIGIKKSKKVLTVSNASVKNILDVFPEIHNKIKNTGISISEDFGNAGNELKLRDTIKKYNLPDLYFLTVGSLEPRKNLLFLIESFIEFKRNNQNNYKLVITGRAAWGSQELKDIIKVNELEKDIIFTGYVADDELLALYKLADCFIYPSIYEGFGLPLLEAMSCGTPVISSNTSSLPEVGGDVPIYFNPYNKDELIDKIEMFVDDRSLRKTLSLKGIKRSKDFSWNKISNQIYREYLNE